MSLDLTGVWMTLPQSAFEETAPDGGFLHFRPRPSNEVDPFTGITTGQSARQIIQAQANQFGWPLVGIYLSGSGGLVPHFAVHRSQFPAQTGPQNQRAERLQSAIDAAFVRVYPNEMVVTDPTDPDFGQTVSLGRFHLVSHVWRYDAGGLYTPRAAGAGDYAVFASVSQAPGNWWQSL